jgi:PAS domain S-box-containing protein
VTPIDLAALLDCTDVAMLVFTPQAGIVFASRAAAELLRSSPAELVGMSTFDPSWDVVRADGSPFPPDERPVSAAFRTRAPVRGVELGVRRSSSEERVWVLLDALPRLDEAGALVNVVVSLRDVTEEHRRRERLDRLRAELVEVERSHAAAMERAQSDLETGRDALDQVRRELMQRERLYWSVFEVLGEGLVVHRVDGSIETANPAAQRILGLSLDTLQGKHAVDASWRLVDEDGRPLAPQDIPSEIARTTGRAVARKLLGVVRGDGTRAWLNVSTQTLRTESGEVVGVVATFGDVTHEREARLAVEHSEARFRQVLSAVPGVVFQLVRHREQTVFTFLSDRAVELFGAAPHTLLFDLAVWETLFARDEMRSGLRRLDEAGESREPWDFTARIEGSERFVRLRAVPEVQSDGAVSWTGVAFDVTHEHRLADQLRHSQRREAMGDLAAGVAHNFNNVLAVILPNLEELREEASPELVPVADDAIDAAQNAAEMVRQLLVTTRREAGHDREPVDLVSVAGDVVRLCRQSFGRRIEISLQTPPSAAVVLARASELHQVLLNLCINARDALAKATGPRLEVRVERADDHVVVEVRDNGVGMDDAVLSRLGEPFFTTKPPGQGTGLGLATAFAILDELHAEVSIESQPGRGTTFRLSFPHADVEASRRRPRDRASSRPRRGRVLLVEDEPLVRRATQRQLERMGHHVIVAADGVEGLRLATTEELDLVLLDLSMPGLSGDAVLAELRGRRPELPVIVLSGHVPDRVALDGAAAVLLKPVVHDALISTLARVLR